MRKREREKGNGRDTRTVDPCTNLQFRDRGKKKRGQTIVCLPLLLMPGNMGGGDFSSALYRCGGEIQQRIFRHVPTCLYMFKIAHKCKEMLLYPGKQIQYLLQFNTPYHD